MNPNKQSNRRKAKALKLTVVDFCSSNPTSSTRRRSNNDHADVVDDNCKVMTSKYTEYFSNNSKPFQVISFPCKPTQFKTLQKDDSTRIRKNKRMALHQQNDQYGNNNTMVSSGGGDDSVASLHQDRIEESNDQHQQPSTPTSIQSSPIDKKRQRRTSITIRELLNYDD
ncbi:predicted protein [Naegleria gruberi]|uniref:Predicted protein n=1 Tax=Naegleria gruberi TaxID=5762 RepID=D2VY82_NAEGR|nr:uncharacterized protein NAEGRDRAFT_74023 [Naegleria gruberi]EFC38204.1 predicted protein [Naegleria gruberi]|eukprot:XP_002670948.1 predicted protein [Naegleria gruberi strain NEG-M]